MKKQMKRTVYEAPVTERFQVELEANLMAASVNEYNHSVETNSHEVVEIDADNWDGKGSSWNESSNWE